MQASIKHFSAFSSEDQMNNLQMRFWDIFLTFFHYGGFNISKAVLQDQITPLL